jgi:hypothetical protein
MLLLIPFPIPYFFVLGQKLESFFVVGVREASGST